MTENIQKKKILIVDEDSFFLELERAFLHRDHFEILEARNGRDALTIMREQHPDLVLLDLYMPVMGGIEVVIRARAEGIIDLPIIIVSKENDPAKIAEMKEAGASDFISKPIEIDELLRVISVHLNESHRSARRLPVTIKLRYKTLDELMPAESKDISTTGIFVRTKKQLGLGSLVELYLYPADDADAAPIKVIGEVVRVQQGHDEDSGAGLKFINLDPASVKIIAGMLDNERARNKIDVMVVDDDGVIREILYDALVEIGWKVEAFDNAVDALKVLDRFNPSLILADIMMPTMSGIEFCETFRKNARHGNIPFIFISSKVDKETLLAARASGATFFIAKPFDAKNVVLKVKELIGLPKS